MKRKFKIMQHQIEQLKEEISAKDLALVKEHFDHMKVGALSLCGLYCGSECWGWRFFVFALLCMKVGHSSHCNACKSEGR